MVGSKIPRERLSAGDFHNGHASRPCNVACLQGTHSDGPTPVRISLMDHARSSVDEGVSHSGALQERFCCRRAARCKYPEANSGGAPATPPFASPVRKAGRFLQTGWPVNGGVAGLVEKST
ncbi:hypothetical protein KM043_002230 [Ampulex compressa]|nr:hypothetical protein KM043_002230 [Ampulex compressa]